MFGLNKKEFQLGGFYTDKITGFSGVATGHVKYLSGCNQVLLTPKVDKDGKLKEANWFDEQRLEISQAHKIIELDNTKTPGFDKQAPAY